MSEKLQKVLATLGLASRREIEKWIAARRVSINGKIVEIGARVGPQDCIRVDGHIVQQRQKNLKPRVLLYHKPIGEICTRHDPENRKTIFESLPLLREGSGRWITVGRLDINTSGLLLITNHGGLAHRLMHPRGEIEREYAVRVFGVIDPGILERLKKGVELEDGLARFDDIVDKGGERSNHWYHVVVKEGRNRLIRRLWESQGIEVSRLIRVRYGDILLPRHLRRGRWEELKGPLKEKLIDEIK